MTDQNDNPDERYGSVDPGVVENDNEFDIETNDGGFISTDPFNIDNEWAQKYLEQCLLDGLAQGTISVYESRLEHFIDCMEFARETSIQNVDKVDVQWFYHHCVHHRELSEGTLKNYKSVIKMFYVFLELQDGINPTLSGVIIENGLTKQLLSKAKNPIEREAISRDEVVKLFAHATCPRNELILQYLYETAGRNSDIRNLRVNNIYLDNLIVEFTNSKGGKDYSVPIRKELALRTEHWIDSGRQTYQNWDKHDYLFPSQVGEELSKERLREIVSEAAEAAGIQAVIGQIANDQGETRDLHRVTPHTLRHSILTHLKDSVQDSDRQRLSGHEDLKTLKRYTHSDNKPAFDLLRDKINQI